MAKAPDANRSRFWQRIQGKLILLLLVLLVPNLLAQVFVYHKRIEAYRSEQLQANLEVARATAKAFETFVHDLLQQELTIGLALTSSQSPTNEDIERILVESQSGKSAVAALAWANPNGTIVAASAPSFVGINFSDRKHFDDIASGRDWTISDLVISKATGEPRFVIMHAIRNTQGELLGIVVANIVPDRLDTVLRIERSKGGGVSLVDSKGMLVYRYPHLNPSWEERDWLRSVPEIKKALDGEEIAWIGRPAQSNEPRIMAGVPIGSISWSAGAGRTEENAMAAVTSTILLDATLFLIVLIGSFGTALGLSRSISNPIKRLRDHALATGYGETYNPAVATGPAEIRELADAFNIMAEELRSREMNLREHREWLQVTLTSIGDAVLTTDTAGNIIFLNPVAAALTGWRFEEAAGQPVQSVFRIINEKTRKPAEDIVERVLREGYIVSLANHTALITHDGREVPIEDSAAPIRDSAGKVIGVVLVFHDVTEKRRAQEALHSTNEELERFNRVAVDRELRMIELKKQINEFCAQAGLPRRYPIASEQPDAEERP